MTPISVQSNIILDKVIGVLYLQGKTSWNTKKYRGEPVYFRVIIHLLTSVVMEACNRITIRLKRKPVLS